MAGTDELGRAFPSNAIKAAEYGRKGALNPPQGQSEDAPSSDVSASTSPKRTAATKPAPRPTPVRTNNAPLEKVRVDSAGRALTTNQGLRSPITRTH